MPDLSDMKLLRNKEYRDEYLSTLVRGTICYQIQALRDQLSLTQAEFAHKIGKPQSMISRLENVEHNRATVQTLLDIACALDIGLVIRFVSYPEFITIMSDVSPEGLRVETFHESDRRRSALQSPQAVATLIGISSETSNQTASATWQANDVSPAVSHRVPGQLTIRNAIPTAVASGLAYTIYP